MNKARDGEAVPTPQDDMNLESFNDESGHRITEEAEDGVKPGIEKMNTMQKKNEEQEIKMNYQNPFKNQNIA